MNAPTPVLEEVWAADIPVGEAAKSATRSYTLCFGLTAALTTACSAARSATSLEIVPRATVEAEEVATEAEDTVEEDMVEEDTVEGRAEEGAEVCSRSIWDTLLRPFSLCLYQILTPILSRSNLLLLRRLWPHVS